MKPQNDAELMRTLMEQIHAYHNPPVEENMLTRGLSKAAMKGANWLSKKFGNLGLDFRSLAQYQTPATLKMFQTWMRQYKQSYENVTWNILSDFFVRNTQLRKIQFNDEISGRPLTKAELAEVFVDDRQVLAKIVGKYMNLMPKNATELNTKVANKEPIAPGDPDGAYAMVVAIIEAALVHMFMMAQPETDAASATGTTGAPAAGTAAAPAAAAAAAPAAAPAAGTPAATPAAAGSTSAPISLSAEDLNTLKRLLGIT